MTMTSWIERLISVRFATFETKRILNKAEIEAFYAARDFFGDVSGVQYYALAQVSLGEIFQSADRPAYLAINWMRSEVVVVDRFGHPAVVIEIHRARPLWLND